MKIFRDHRQDGNVAVATLKSVGSKSEVQKKEEKKRYQEDTEKTASTESKRRSTEQLELRGRHAQRGESKSLCKHAAGIFFIASPCLKHPATHPSHVPSAQQEHKPKQVENTVSMSIIILVLTLSVVGAQTDILWSSLSSLSR